MVGGIVSSAPFAECRPPIDAANFMQMANSDSGFPYFHFPGTEISTSVPDVMHTSGLTSHFRFARVVSLASLALAFLFFRSPSTFNHARPCHPRPHRRRRRLRPRPFVSSFPRLVVCWLFGTSVSGGDRTERDPSLAVANAKSVGSALANAACVEKKTAGNKSRSSAAWRSERSALLGCTTRIRWNG